MTVHLKVSESQIKTSLKRILTYKRESKCFGSFWEFFWHFLKRNNFLGTFENCLENFWEFFWIALQCWGFMFGILWEFFRNSLGILLAFFRKSFWILNCKNCEFDLQWYKFWLKERQQQQIKSIEALLRDCSKKSRTCFWGKNLLPIGHFGFKTLPLHWGNAKHPVRKWKWKAENRASSKSTSQGF